MPLKRPKNDFLDGPLNIFLYIIPYKNIPVDFRVIYLSFLGRLRGLSKKSFLGRFKGINEYLRVQQLMTAAP